MMLVVHPTRFTIELMLKFSSVNLRGCAVFVFMVIVADMYLMVLLRLPLFRNDLAEGIQRRENIMQLDLEQLRRM